MFKQLRKALGLSPEPAAQLGVVTPGQLAQWAGAQRWAFAFDGEPDRFVLQGQVVEHPWRLESGAPSRDYMQGTELRVRAELALNPDAHVMVISRALKEELEGRVYGAITNSLQTTVDQSLPQEMRWLSIYEEMRWPQLPASFVRAFAVVGEDLDTARHWVNAALVSQLMRDQHQAPPGQAPLVLMVSDASVSLRMQSSGRYLPDLEYAMGAFLAACVVATHQLPHTVDDHGPSTLPVT
ncbi:MAG TPA: hypothetical protein PKN26_09200 [Giesbergeria sp.]|nr:hypothetical protein [Giesbergeria sp.]HNE71247.1 hypothetical protein [Giesbergeria sp.]HNK06720.1 hypothetical protein [Giesbergeria sp.]HNM40018.1 hypothetical protein [Giesbergeria sp.]HNN15098.1 hypothetical protein [Giesbergeria sp.]